MKVHDVVNILNANVVCGYITPDDEVKAACGADLMSDVLAFAKNDALMLTGMVNTQVLRTAEMLDVRFVVFVRGKSPTPEMIEMAGELDIVLMFTTQTMYTACGKLYSNGLMNDTKEQK